MDGWMDIFFLFVAAFFVSEYALGTCAKKRVKCPFPQQQQQSSQSNSQRKGRMNDEGGKKLLESEAAILAPSRRCDAMHELAWLRDSISVCITQ